MPKYSFVVPVYNVEEYLPQCIESILSQDFQDFELILVDDGSSDNSGMISDEFSAKDNRIVVVHKENEGVSIARNVGIDISRGEYIIFVDSDDWIEYNLLSSVSQYVDNFDIIFFGHNSHYPDGDVVSYHPSNVACMCKEDMEREIIHLKTNSERFEYFGYTWNKVFKASIIKANNIRYVEGLILREDELFTMEYCQQVSTLKVINFPLYNYRFLNNGLTSIKKSSDEILLYSNLMYVMADKWTNMKLKNLDKLRYSSYVLSAASVETNVFRCLSLVHKAFKEKKKYSKQDYSFLSIGLIKTNAFVSSSYYLFRMLRNLLNSIL